MARYLIGWELGASPDLQLDIADLARGLLRRGHQVHIASGDPVTLATQVEEGLERAILPAPVPPLRPDLIMRPPREGGFADKLHAQGFGSPAVLAALASAWRNLCQAVAADVAVSVGAPVLALSARGRLPLLVAGSAESLPPVELPNWPRLHANIAPAQRDEKLVLHASLAASAVGAAPVAAPTDVLRGDAVLVYGLPQIDPYAALRREKAGGPLLALPAPCVPPGKPAMVAVLDVHHPDIETLVLALSDFGKTPVHVHIRGMTVPMYNFLSQAPGIAIHTTPAAALATLPEASFVLHHANPRVAALAIGLGVPQSLLPYTVEQNAVADMLQRFNAGYRLQSGTDPQPVADRLTWLFRDLDQVQNAQHFARQAALQPPQPALETLVSLAEGLAAR
ncbi:MAG: hypothetical protein AB7R90_09240 [Reyranellaceae bacterium]